MGRKSAFCRKKLVWVRIMKPIFTITTLCCALTTTIATPAYAYWVSDFNGMNEYAETITVQSRDTGYNMTHEDCFSLHRENGASTVIASGCSGKTCGPVERVINHTPVQNWSGCMVGDTLYTHADRYWGTIYDLESARGKWIVTGVPAGVNIIITGVENSTYGDAVYVPPRSCNVTGPTTINFGTIAYGTPSVSRSIQFSVSCSATSGPHSSYAGFKINGAPTWTGNVGQGYSARASFVEGNDDAACNCRKIASGANYINMGTTLTLGSGTFTGGDIHGSLVVTVELM